MLASFFGGAEYEKKLRLLALFLLGLVVVFVALGVIVGGIALVLSGLRLGLVRKAKGARQLFNSTEPFSFMSRHPPHTRAGDTHNVDIVPVLPLHRTPMTIPLVDQPFQVTPRPLSLLLRTSEEGDHPNELKHTARGFSQLLPCASL